jgi:O-antigen ligase/tetratricopeptide (TPR) repeat protein
MAIAVFAFAAVHESVQFGLCLLLIGTGLFGLYEHPRRIPRWLLAIGLAGCLVPLFACIPIPIHMHAWFQPGIAELTVPSLELVEASYQPLALRPREALKGCTILFCSFVYLMGCTTFLYRSRRIRESAFFIVLIGVALCILAWLQLLSGAEYIYWTSGLPKHHAHFFGSFAQANHAGALIAAILPLAMAMRAPKNLVFFPILAFGLWTTQSRGAMVAGAVSTAVYAAIHYRGATLWASLGVLLTALSAALYLDLTQYRQDMPIGMERMEDWSTGRLSIWKDASELLTEAPFFGMGHGGFLDSYATVKTLPTFNQTHHSHQEVLELLINYGWVGGGLLLGLWIAAIALGARNITMPMGKRDKRWPQRRKWRAAAFGGLIGLTCSAMVDFPLHGGATYVLFIFLAGASFGPYTLKKETGTANQKILAAAGGIGLCLLLALKQQPASAYAEMEYWLHKGQRLRQAQQYDKGLDSLRSAIRAAPLYSRALRQYALTLRHSDLQTAVTQAERASRLAPANALTWMTLAELYTFNKEPEKAWMAWRNCLSLNLPRNDDAEPFIRIALSAGSMPVQAAEKAIPDMPLRQEAAGRILLEMGETEAAEKLIRRAVEKNEGSKLAYARLLYKSDRSAEAWEMLKTIPRNSCQVSKLGAKILSEINAPLDAALYYRIAIGHCGRSKSLERGLLVAKLGAGDAGAIPEALKALEEAPKNSGLRKLLMHALSASGQNGQLYGHYEFLILEGQATQDDYEDLQRVRKGLPPRHLPKKIPPPLLEESMRRTK